MADCDEAVTDEFVRRFFDDEQRGRDGLTQAERAADDTPSQLRDRARRLVGKLDADAARRRHDRRIRGRRVQTRTDGDGVGHLSGTELPADAIATAYEHVDAIARCLRNGGDPRTLDALRADIFTELLSGGGHGRDDLFGPGVPEPDVPGPDEPDEPESESRPPPAGR